MEDVKRHYELEENYKQEQGELKKQGSPQTLIYSREGAPSLTRCEDMAWNAREGPSPNERKIPSVGVSRCDQASKTEPPGHRAARCWHWPLTSVCVSRYDRTGQN